jgi:hypothetical protein
MNNSNIQKLFSFQNYLLVLFAILISFRTIRQITSFSILDYIDELLIISFLFYSFYRIFKTLKFKVIYLYIISIIIFIIVISLDSPYYSGLFKTTVQALMYCKFIIFFLLVYDYLDDKSFHRFMRFLFYFTIIGFFINLILGSTFYEIVGTRILERNGLYRYTGFQLGANVLGIVASVLIFYSLYNNNKRENLVWHFILIITIIMSGSHTGILLLFIVYLMYLFDTRKLSKSMLLSIFISPFLLLIIFSATGLDEKLLETSDRFEAGNESGYARTVVLYNAILIAIDNFPFGAGAGSYATPLSRDSEVYYDYGMDKVKVIQNFLAGNEKASGIYDTSFGMLFGELGFIGTFLFIFLHFIILMKLYKQYNKNILVILLLFASLLFIAATKALFIEVYFSFYLALLAVIPLKIKYKQKREVDMSKNINKRERLA